MDEMIETHAKALKIEFHVLKNLYQGKTCPKYGTNEPLHARKVRGGKLVIFNISEKYRSEKISEGRKKTKALKVSADAPNDENDKT